MNIDRKNVTVNTNIINVASEDDIIDINTTVTDKDSFWSGLLNSNLAEYLSKTQLDIYKSCSTTNSFVKALQILDLKASAARKTLTFWDAYAITDTVKTTNDFEQKYGSLAPNHSLVISSPLIINGTTYNTGDMISKNNNNEMLHIQSAQTGYYKPTAINSTSGNTSEITYTYESGSDGTPVTLTIPSVTESIYYNGSIIINDQNGESASNNLLQDSDGNTVRPIWEAHIYNVNSSTLGETIYDGVTITYTQTNFKFKNLTSLPIIILFK